MATILLSAAGAGAGGALLGPVVGAGLGTSIGRTIGAFAGSMLDGALFGGQDVNVTRGARLSDLTVQTSTYGEAIPLVYGTIRLAGNVIWSRPIQEKRISSTQSAGGGKGGGGSGATVTTTSYRYTVTLAVALCEGPIDGVLRAWADSRPLNLSRGGYRLYKGTEDQLPDALIEAAEGIGKTPAYRGLAYVVLENFPLEDYGNRIPNFTFEVKKSLLPNDVNGQSIEEMITAVTLIPGSGEFVYDPDAQEKIPGFTFNGVFYPHGNRQYMNVHSHTGQADVLLSLDQMQESLPNLEWVAVVCNWFGTSLDAASCQILPSVEYQGEVQTSPDSWSVAGYSRTTARLMSRDAEGRPNYGGTPDDGSILRLLDELHNRGLKVMFYPMFFIDTPDKPWRGRVTGNASAVSQFFTKTNGYNRFIQHYAQLVQGRVDAFVIGSELVGLTRVSSSAGVYPAVEALTALAATVKGMVGSTVTVTYAANWDEYHHTDGGWYHLDALWASPHIDVVGIDAYFPLTDAPEEHITLTQTLQGWESGEYYDYYYTDEARTQTEALQPDYAVKNLDWWWKHTHVNPNGQTTAWQPQMKPVWFTEVGFASIDGATNQPNVFYDPASSEGTLPRHSRGQPSLAAQRRGIAATEAFWQNSAMVQQRFYWTWDARPYPYYPALGDIWSDGSVWSRGHWLNGKLGAAGISGIVSDLCQRAGVSAQQIDTAGLTGVLEGIAFNKRLSYRDALEMLQQAFAFDLIDDGQGLRVVMHGAETTVEVDADLRVADSTVPDGMDMTRRQALELPSRVEVAYFDPARDYELGTERAMREGAGLATQQRLGIYLPMVMRPMQARHIAERLLFQSWIQQTHYRLNLPRRYAALQPSDIVRIQQADGIVHRMRVLRTRIDTDATVRIEAVAEEQGVYIPSVTMDDAAPQLVLPAQDMATTLEWLDIPALPDENLAQGRVLLAVAGLGEGWRGAVLYRSDDGGQNWAQQAVLNRQATMGVSMGVLPAALPEVRDWKHTLDIALLQGELVSAASELALWNGANLALLGDELLQFQQAEMLSSGHVRLSGFVRGRYGTEAAMHTHGTGERFVLLDSDSLHSLPMDITLRDSERLYKLVTAGQTLGSVESVSYPYTAKHLLPLSPVHLHMLRQSDDALRMQWVRRSRAGSIWPSGADIPLHEERELYRVQILHATTGQVLRSWEPTTSEQDYTLAEQLSDGDGYVPTQVVWRVAQVSAIAGAGTWASMTSHVPLSE